MNIELEAERINEFVKKGNYHAAYNIALSNRNGLFLDAINQDA